MESIFRNILVAGWTEKVKHGIQFGLNSQSMNRAKISFCSFGGKTTS